MEVFLWIVAVAMIVVGIVGTVLPALPGVVLVWGGVLLAAWVDDFTRIGGWTIGILTVLAALAFVVEYVAAAAGAKRVGASRLAIIGAVIGTVAGVFTGFIGLLFLPLAGAAIGEFVTQRNLKRAGKVGVATWLGYVIGTAAKVAIVFTMVGVFIGALLI